MKMTNCFSVESVGLHCWYNIVFEFRSEISIVQMGCLFSHVHYPKRMKFECVDVAHKTVDVSQRQSENFGRFITCTPHSKLV